MQEPTWAIVELMGHVRMGGRVSEEERFGTKMGRIDIPRGEGFYTQYFGGQSVYRITIVEEAAARGVAAAMSLEPVHTWEMPKTLAIGSSHRDTDHDHDDDETPFGE